MISSAQGDADQHRLAARFVDGPHVSAAAKADQILAGWLADLEPPRAAAIRQMAGHFPRANAILQGIAAASPYLFDLMRADAGRLIRLLGCEPERHLAHLIATTCDEVAAAADEARVMQSLRRMKSEAALLIALCDIGGVWPVMQVTAALTDLAEASVRSALRYLLRQEAARGILGVSSRQETGKLVHPVGLREIMQREMPVRIVAVEINLLRITRKKRPIPGDRDLDALDCVLKQRVSRG